LRLLGEKITKEGKMKAIDTHDHPGTKEDVIKKILLKNAQKLFGL
jgi:hypothetical protein